MSHVIVNVVTLTGATFPVRIDLPEGVTPEERVALWYALVKSQGQVATVQFLIPYHAISHIQRQTETGEAAPIGIPMGRA